VRLESVSGVFSRFLLTVGKLWRDTFIGVACRGLFDVSRNKCMWDKCVVIDVLNYLLDKAFVVGY